MPEIVCDMMQLNLQNEHKQTLFYLSFVCKKHPVLNYNACKISKAIHNQSYQTNSV
jgi:hypothetical protein